MRWKALMEMEKQQYEQVDRNIKEAHEKLEQEMEAARHEHQVILMRQGMYGLGPLYRHLISPRLRTLINTKQGVLWRNVCIS